jgi:hypothetical protein
MEGEDSYTRRGGAAGTTVYATQILGQLRRKEVLFGGLKNTERHAKR